MASDVVTAMRAPTASTGFANPSCDLTTSRASFTSSSSCGTHLMEIAIGRIFENVVPTGARHDQLDDSSKSAAMMPAWPSEET
jgi:hypothetical protein